ncbi:MAG: RNA pseudouridine synthase [Muribaculaceae bacterium]|nr:RNA pseudouridine synthase [Muribaculaceae bacterium]
MDDKLHRFLHDVSGVEPPAQFTFPFHYVPHELCKVAAAEVMSYAQNQELWRDELMAGKMLGVLVVKDADGALGYLAAYSGNLASNGNNPYFVPHIYNLLEPQGLFRTGEAEITEINHRIEQLENSAKKRELKTLIDATIAEHKSEENEMLNTMQTAKARRDDMRAAGVTPEQEKQLIKESQFQKAEMKRLKKRHRLTIEEMEQRIKSQEEEINHLKAMRKAMSEKLQYQLFKLFVVRNARGESMDVATIFERRLNRLPPGGTGECCAPKLLQYAFLHGYKPMCMAEFWVGQSPQGEVRHHGHYYPACRSKCLPLLEFMLQGLDVEDNPLITPSIVGTRPDSLLKVVYEDQWLIVIDKPIGMLTVPGKEKNAISALEVVSRMKNAQCTMQNAQFQPQPNYELCIMNYALFEVHRLDQATSGLVVFAKTHEAQKKLRLQFEERTVSKTYIALLDGILPEKEGTIDLPLRPDIDDRPRQVVDFENGKQAITKYRVLEYRDGKTLVEFTPLTGRTHQLRVHASHPQGLNCPIVGDMLYGTASHRLCLHAQSLSFNHPVTGEAMRFNSTEKTHQDMPDAFWGAL